MNILLSTSKTFITVIAFILLGSFVSQVLAEQPPQRKLPTCPSPHGDDFSKWDKCYTRFENNGNVYEGEYKKGNPDGFGVLYYSDGSIYKGNWKDGNWDGIGIHTVPSGKTYPGTYSKNVRIKEHAVNFEAPGKKKIQQR